MAKVEARPYQARIVEKTIRAFQHEGGQSALIHSPTGSGKTVIAYLTLTEILRQRLISKKGPVQIGWAAMRRNLLTQAEAENHKFGFGLKIHYLSMFDKNPPKLDVLVVDEAQHDATTSMANLHGISTPELVLGLSATPWRADRVGLCFDKIIKDAGIAELIKLGFLSEYHHYTIPKYTPEAVAQTYLSDPDKWGKSVVFFHKEEDCQKLVQLLCAGGITTELVTHRSNREVQLSKFTTGETQVLVNMMILTEGFDCPDLKTVWVRPSVKSCTMQMGGRVFRKHPDYPHKQIVQCAETVTPFLKIAPAAQQYILVHGQWLSLKPSEKVETLYASNLKLLANTRTNFDAAFFKHKKKQRFTYKSDDNE